MYDHQALILKFVFLRLCNIKHPKLLSGRNLYWGILSEKIAPKIRIVQLITERCAPQYYIDMFSDYTYQWFMDNNPTDFVLTVYNPHIFISKSGILYFSWVDASDDRDYHCTVSITDGAPESRSSPAYSLQVTYRDGECKPILPAICSLIKITIGQSFPFLN